MSELITLEKFKQSIMNSMKTPGMQDAAAVSLAEHVLNFFGFQDRIIDNMLDPEDRDAFYMLEDVGLLTTEREETGLPDGREWRIHYWLIREDRILKALKSGDRRNKKPTDTISSIYDTIPDDIWFRRIVEEEEKDEDEEEVMDEADWETPILPGEAQNMMQPSFGSPPPPPKQPEPKPIKEKEKEDEEGEEIKFVSEDSASENDEPEDQ